MNKVILIGRLTKNPELKKNENALIVNFTIAVNRNFKNKDGKYDADFISCTAFKNTAEFINKYFIKGSQIALSGKIQTRNYDAQDGSKRYVTEVVVENVEFTGEKKKESTVEQTNIMEEIPNNIKSDYSDEGIHLSDEDLPF